MTKIKTTPFDVAEYLDTSEDMAAYLQAVLEENDPALFRLALGDIAKAKGMSAIAEQVGVNRASLYKSLSDNGNPTYTTVQKLIEALGLKLTVSS
ncbi:MAG: addiction module antidote protein [Paracoccus sp. (in: a-proteobacteria)]